MGWQLTSLQLAAFSHATSHAHELPHDTPEHDSVPAHVTSQRPDPHATLRHDCAPVQSTVHDSEPRQLTPFRHELGVEQAMSQCQPAGQTTWPTHPVAVTAQSMVHSLLSGTHDVHCDGHEGCASDRKPSSTAASIAPVPAITQNPSLQILPSRQSALDWQTYASLACLIEQLEPSARAIATTASDDAKDLLDTLRSIVIGRS